MSARVPGKKETLLAYLQRGVAMIHLDARRPGVRVPPQFAQEAHLRLNLSYRYGIPDLVVDDARVQATLSFGGRPFQCVLPWQSIFGITSHTTGDGQVWPEDLPVEVVQTMADGPRREPAQDRSTPAGGPPQHGRPALSAVQGVSGSASPEEPPKSPDEPPRRPHLRLVR